MKKISVGINGFGRIGRAFLKVAMTREDVEIVAINDLGDILNLAYLLRYDSAYGKADFSVDVVSGALVIDGKKISVTSEKEPQNISWGKLGADVVVESTGAFESYEKAKSHLLGGAKKVVITAPVKDEPLADIQSATVLMGINDDALKTCVVSSNGSCTTNAGAPLLAIFDETLGVEKAVLNTIHAYTATQSIVDSPAKGDMRRGRAGAQNIVPSSTGAAIAVTKALTSLQNKFDGVAVRVPVVSGSLVDITFIASRETTAEEVNKIMKDASMSEKWKKIFSVTEEPLVSSDIIGLPYASIADLAMTRVVGGNLVKVLAWYDNEMGYANTLLLHVLKAGENIQKI